MAQCKHYEICGRDALEETEEGLCILHSRIDGRDKKDFKEAFDKYRKAKGDNFDRFVFPEVTDFSRVTFTKGANFSRATFTKAVCFHGAIFKDGADFIRTTFRERADFSNATFTKVAHAYFIDATFAGYSDFSNATFEGQANFNGVKFPGGANFSGTTFTKGAAAYFAHAKFAVEADFTRATFAEKAYFAFAMFNTQANCSLATFNGPTLFNLATFTEGADFSGTTFEASVDFRWARFYARTVFASKHDDGRTIQIFSGAEVDFRDVIIEPLDSLVFRDADLTQCRFQGTDLRKAEIAGAKWAEIDNVFWGRRDGVYDEAPLREDEPRSWHHIEKVYRELKQNYEDRRDYERARDFHYGEKEMRRKHAKTLGHRSWGLRSLLFIYKWVSGYGERYPPPIGWAVALLIGCTFLYLWFGLYPEGESTRLDLWKPWDWSRAAHYSFRVMFLLKPVDFVPIGLGKLVNTVETVLGPLLIGLFGLAVRQRLKR